MIKSNIADSETSYTRTSYTGNSYIEWSPIIAGSALAISISIILLQFGNGLGLSVSRHLEGENVKGIVFTIGLWLLWTQIMASMAGGYLAGRMRGQMEKVTDHEGEVRDGTHGLLVWATSTISTTVALAITGALAAIAADQSAEVQNNMDNVNEALTRSSAIIFSFMVAVSSVASALAAWWMGSIGGDHRDRKIDISKHISFRKRT